VSSRTDQPVIADSPGTRDRWFILALVASNYFTIYLHRNLINYIQPALKRSIEDGGLKLTDTEIGRHGWSPTAWHNCWSDTCPIAIADARSSCPA